MVHKSVSAADEGRQTYLAVDHEDFHYRLKQTSRDEIT
jgi:hypothetical protein